MLGNLAGIGTGHTHLEGVDDNGKPSANLTATKYFKRIACGHETIVSIQLNWNEDATHTLAGTLKVQGSNHAEPPESVAGSHFEWVDLDVVFPVQVTSGEGGTGVSMAFIGWRWIRLVFTFSSGSGTLIVRTVIKKP